MDSGNNLVTGAYALDIQGTPYSSDDCGAATIQGLAGQQWITLWNLGRLDRRSRANLNVVAGDYLGDPAGEGDTNWPIVSTVLALNKGSNPQVLSRTSQSGASVTVSCKPSSPTDPGPTTMVVYPVVQGPQSPNLKTFTADQGSSGVQGSVSASDFPGAGPTPDDSYLVAACARPGSPLDPPGSSSGAEISRIVIPYFGGEFQLSATPADLADLPFTCSGPETQPIQVSAYPAGNPFSPDAQVFSGNGTVQATYSRRGSYDVSLDCGTGTRTSSTSRLVPDSAFPPALTIRADKKGRWLYCDRASQLQLQTPFTLTLAALTPNAPTPLSAVGSPDQKAAVLTVQPDWFPPGDYLLAATCVSNDRPQLPWAAKPLTLSSSQIPHREVTAEITGCSAQGGNAYACALQVTLGKSLAVNTVFSVGIGGGGFANPSGGDRPQVTAIQGCQVPPLPSPYLADGNGGYTRYDVNIGPGGCAAGAVVTLGQAVTGAGAALISQQVTVPGLGAVTTAPVMLP